MSTPILSTTDSGSAVVVTGPSEGTTVRFFADQIEIKTQGGEVDVCDMRVHAGCEPPMHVHEREDEAFFVLEGSLTFFTEAGETRAEAGTYVRLPRGTAHTYAVDSGSARILVNTTPSGFAGMFTELSERLGDTMEAAPAPEHFPVIGQAMAEHGIQAVGPNPRYL